MVTIGAAILSIVGTHLLTLLQARGLDLALAVALGTLIGPAQVGARVVEMLAGHHYHPAWTMIASVALVAVAAVMLFAGFPVVALAIVLYGAGNGIGTVARGAVPLAVFGPDRYPVFMGRLALPILISMAVSPYLGGLAFQQGGADWTLGLLAGLALANVALAVALRLSIRRTDRDLTRQGLALRLIAFVCAAQVLVQIGAFFWPALVPEMIVRWRLSNSEAGWITAAFYGAYMLAVPVLVTLTDRIDPKRVYLAGVGIMILGHGMFAALADGFWSALAARALTGIGWAGTYMTGLKLLADKVDGTMLSRAAAGHAASIGISGALSYVCADLLASVGGWRFAFAAAAASAVLAWLIIVAAVPRADPSRKRHRRAGAVRFPPGAEKSLRHGLCARIRPAHPGDGRAARLGRGVPCLRRGQHRYVRRHPLADRHAYGARPHWNAREPRRQ